MKIRPVEGELFHAKRQTDGQADTTKLIVAFRNSANAPKNETADKHSMNEHVKENVKAPKRK